jgi:hypothetical protein
VALVLATGCATTSPPPGAALPRLEAADLARRWEDEWRTFSGLRAAVELDVTRRGFSQRAAGVILLSPTRLRFELVTPLGLPSHVAVAGPDRVLVWSTTERRAWTGRPTAESLGRWLGVPLTPASLIRLLLGQAPPLAEPESARYERSGGPHLEFERDAVRHRVWMAADGYPLRVQLDGARSLTATFERGPAGRLGTVLLEVPAERLEVQLRYLAVEPVSPPPEAFELQLPPGVRIEQVD